MKTISWNEKEMKLIKEMIGERCFDVNNEEDWDVSITYSKRDLQYVICPNFNNPKNILYCIDKIYRNAKGDVINEENISIVQRPRLQRYLKTFLQRMLNDTNN